MPKGVVQGEASEVQAITTRPPGFDPHRKLPPPGTLLELVNLDLRGEIDQAGTLALQSDPWAWLNALYLTKESLAKQFRDRELRIQLELESPERSPDSHDKLLKHGEWMRRAKRFERVVDGRIEEVRRLVPDDDLRALLFDGAGLNPEDKAAVAQWQARVKKILSL